MNALYSNFQQYFEIIIADTADLLAHVYKLRYQVLCIEKRLPGFDSTHRSDHQEKDCYDNHSLHALLRYRPTNDFIGTVRLILPNVEQPDKKLPVEIYGHADSTLCDIQALPRSETAEISRFLVISRFDRRKDDRRKDDRRKKVAGNFEEKRLYQERRRKDRRSALSIALVLMAGVMRMSIKYNIHNWLSVMDPALNRLLGFYGLNFNPIGPLVDYHGFRRSYYVKVEDVLEKMYKNHYDAWEVVTECGTYSRYPAK